MAQPGGMTPPGAVSFPFIHSMSTPSSNEPEVHDATYATWATVIGLGLGLVVGLTHGRWFMITVGFTFSGYVIGAVIDRLRR